MKGLSVWIRTSADTITLTAQSNLDVYSMKPYRHHRLDPFHEAMDRRQVSRLPRGSAGGAIRQSCINKAGMGRSIAAGMS